MKKVLMISVSALALSAGAAFAGQVADITGTYKPLNNVAPASDAAKADTTVAAGNSSTIDQIGDGNKIGKSTTDKDGVTTITYGVDRQVTDTAGTKSVIHQGSNATGGYASYNATPRFRKARLTAAKRPL